MIHRWFAIFLTLTCVAAMGAERKRPNILFIMSDDHASHAISAYGSKINQTPEIDRLAREGMKFNNCFVNNSICTPSRAAILTGKYSHLNGVTVFNPFDGSQPHVARYLKQAGYQTAVVGKWHLFSDPTGFDYWNILPGQGKYHNPDFIEMGKTNVIKGYASDIITDISLRWLRERDKTKPFLLFAHHKAPHREWSPSEKYTNLYENIDIPEPVTFNDTYKGRSKAAAEATMRIDRDFKKTDLKRNPPSNLSPEELKKWNYQRYIKDYLRCIASVDESVGRILRYLDEEGIAEDTLVIYTSDQGFFLGDHGWYDKRFIYEESLRMPFLVRYPRLIKKNSQTDAMTLNVDFAPTFMDLAGLPMPSDMQGKSLVPILEGKKPRDWRTSMYYRYYHYPADHRVQPHLGVRTLTQKLIHFNKLDEWEMYDLRKDPYETNNVYHATAYRRDREKLTKELYRLKKELKDEDQFASGAFDPAQLLKIPFTTALRMDFEDAAAAQPGRNGKALTLNGESQMALPASLQLDPSGKPLSISAWCKPEAENGVIFSIGGGGQGLALYLRDSIPEFCVRSEGNLATARSSKKIQLSEWVHLKGELNAYGELRISVNDSSDSFPNAAPITKKPAEGATIGNDPGSKAGNYKGETHWKGQIDDLVITWGTETSAARSLNQ